MYGNYNEAAAAWAADRPMLEGYGIHLSGAASYTFGGVKQDYNLAMDAQPTLVTNPNSAVPAIFTTLVDPDVIEVLFSPTLGAQIAGGERKKGTWVDTQIMFAVVEHTGETSSYGDFATSGMSNLNVDWPQRQNYLYQTIKRYGDLEVERAGAGKVNWINELDKSAANNMNRLANLTYFYGVQGLQNYGLFNDPGLFAPIAPAPKAYGGITWYSGGVIQATANEIWKDIQDVYTALVVQSSGLINAQTPLTLALSPQSEAALLTTNSFGLNVNDMIKKNLPNLKVISAVQYATQSASNPQGLPAGNFMQMFANSVEGQETMFAAYSEKMRSHAVVRKISSYDQKISGGTWGVVIKMQFAIAGMIGI